MTNQYHPPDPGSSDAELVEPARPAVLVLDNPLSPGTVKFRSRRGLQDALRAPLPLHPVPATRDPPRGFMGAGATEPMQGIKAYSTEDRPKPPVNTIVDLYLTHFGLSERPFSLLPDPEFLFWTPAHRRAYAILEYGIMTRAPITLVTGEVGAGKTTLVHQLLRTIGEDVRIGLISNAHGSRGELLQWVLMALGQPVPEKGTYVELFSAFQSYLISEYAQGCRVILVFDEAQNLNRETLEELRMFTNINANKDELLQIVLVGQPELRDMVRRPDMRQFAQRVTAAYHLSAMDCPTVRAYISHRMKVAGAQRMIFSDFAIRKIHEVTGGVPRLVNQLCDLSLVYACVRGNKRVMEKTVQSVLDEGVFFGGFDRSSENDREPGALSNP